MEMQKGLTYEDVLLVPRHSTITSRRHVTLDQELDHNIKLKIPLIASPMDTVTEVEMVGCYV